MKARYQQAMKQLKQFIDWWLVFFGYRVWVRQSWHPNMPKSHSCPEHKATAKRCGHTSQGAYYWCKQCSDKYGDGNFFIKSPHGTRNKVIVR